MTMRRIRQNIKLTYKYKIYPDIQFLAAGLYINVKTINHILYKYTNFM